MPISLGSMSPEPTRKQCCYTAALEERATFCGECGKPLIRCMATEKCHGLLDDQGLCTVCVHPVLQVDAGATSAARVGDAVALPLTLTNASIVKRPLMITGFWVREGDEGEWREQPLGWEELKRGESRSIRVVARDIRKSGSHTIAVRLAVSNHFNWRKECFAFKSVYTLDVMPEEVAQSIKLDVKGDFHGGGANLGVDMRRALDRLNTKTQEITPLHLSRIEAFEREHGLRGISKDLYVPRNVHFCWSGFPSLETPVDGPITTPNGLLIFGRNRSVREGGLVDARLLAETPDGEVDRDLSLTLSRHHFEIYIECDRLMLRVVSDNGVRVDGEAYGRDKKVILQDGSVISPWVRRPDAVKIKIHFQTEHKRVSRITLARTPASRREG